MQQNTWHESVRTFFRKAAESTKGNLILAGVGILLVAIVIFQAGILVGIRKERFMRSWSEHYGAAVQPLPVAHGTSGQVVSIALPTFIVHDADGTEKSVLVHEGTLVRIGRDRAYPSDITTSDTVVVIGTPNSQGMIRANLVRIMPRVEDRQDGMVY